MARTGKKAVFGFLPEGRFFAGANTAEGFQSFYPELFRDSELDALFRIEGGPGTGKSTLMKKTAETAEKLGAEVERYFCSSDPDSLDAVRIRPAGSTRLVALCDCTEPHPRAESSPGIVSRTVDLGRFRNDRKLASHRDEILRLQEQKASAYSAAYLYLSAAGKVRQARTGILTETCDLEAMHAAAKRSLLGITGEGSSEIRRPLSAVSMKGSAVIAADENCCSRCFITEDIYGSASIYLSVLSEEARSNGLSLLLAPDCVAPQQDTSVSIPEAGLTVIASGAVEEHRAIRTGRFIDKGELARRRRELRAAVKEEEELYRLACEALKRAAGSHFRLEELYSSAMDFAKKEKADAEILKLIGELINAG
ncbi:MAG: hypothetical protein SPJ23_05580 [Eubacteriales bacterium]|nr:hypothetical protein [Eubacteriales bacterium]